MQKTLNTLFTDTAFPCGNYTPHGYLDNPAHSMVANRSGVVRSVPPLGFGFWCRPLPWGYTSGLARDVNYLSFLHLRMKIGETNLHDTDDFANHDIDLHSTYHSSRIFTYNFTADGVRTEIAYTLPHEKALLCTVTYENTNDAPQNITLFATNMYGYIARRWWGGDGMCVNTNKARDALVSKIWAYGDVFILDADTPADGLFAHKDAAEWDAAVRTGEKCDEHVLHCGPSDAVYATRVHTISLSPGEKTTITFCLARDVNEIATEKTCADALDKAEQCFEDKIAEDNAFYSHMPQLTGDWPAAWKEGILHDFETLRMNVRPACGIFKNRWDGMQIFSPRSVLGETALDMMALSYTDIACAKEVILTTFADAPAPNIPCSREDGSMNMIGSDGSECGTSPVWGLPFKVIMSIYRRDKDTEWLAKLYPYMADFIEWWCENRTDDEGWFFCRNSWESGQDGSCRFCVDVDTHEGDPADFVRTVDVEATMAHAMQVLSECATVLGDEEAAQNWQTRAEETVERTRNMFYDGWFRDVDGRTNTPIILDDYHDAMMFLPLSLDIATPEQVKEFAPRLEYFRENPTHWLEWPSFMMFITDAAWKADMRTFIADIIADTAHRMYDRTTGRTTFPAEKISIKLPEPYNYRIPGVAWEYWPMELKEGKPYGCENYAWGATLPMHLIRIFMGYRVDETNDFNTFTIAPTLPTQLRKAGAQYGMSQLRFQDISIRMTVECTDTDRVQVTIDYASEKTCVLDVTNSAGEKIAESSGTAGQLAWTCVHGEQMTVRKV